MFAMVYSIQKSGKRVIAEVMAEKVETFQLESVDRNHLRDKIEGLLHTLIGDLEESYRADNATPDC